MKQTKETISKRIFNSMFKTGTLTAFTLVGAGFVDSVIISRFLGIDAVAAAGLAYPLYSVAGIVYGCIGTGFKSMASQRIVRSDMEGFQRIYSVSILLSVLISVILTALLIVLAGPMAFLLGARGESAGLLDLTKQYWIGLAIGLPALVLNVVLSTALHFDNGAKRVELAHILSMAADVALDFVAVLTGKGLFAVGLASSVSAYISLIVLCTHFFSKENTLKLRFVKPQKGELKELFHLGSERVVARTLNFIRPLIINPLVLMLGGTPAMAALSIRNSLMSFVSIPGYGISDGVSVTADIANNLKSRIELKETGRLAHRYAAVFELIPGILLCALSVPIAMFYLPESTGAERAILIFALCMGGVKLLFETLLTARISYLQAIRRIREAKWLLFAFDFAAIIVCVLTMGGLFGTYGLMAADLLVMAIVYIDCARHNRRVRLETDDYLRVGEDCNVSPGDIIELDIRSLEDCALTAEQVELFCRGHKADAKQSRYAGLCTEEAAAILFGITQQAKLKQKEDASVKLHMCYQDGKARIHFRFYCRGVSLAAAFERYHADADESGASERAVLRAIAGEIRLYRSLDVDNLMIIV